MSFSAYLRIWLASARYSIVRTMMFRFDFLMWSLVELFWMGVNLLLIEVVYSHTDAIAGWSKFETLLLVGTSMLTQRLLMGFFWSNLFEMGRNIRSGHFDFFLAQPGNPLFMVSTRKIDLDGILNVFVALGLVIYSLGELNIQPGIAQIFAYGAMVLCGLMINYGALLLLVSLTFWITSTQGIEGGYFTLMEFSRLPRQAFHGITNIVFVWVLPTAVISNVPARTLIDGIEPLNALWLAAATLVWVSIGVFVFGRGLRRYSSASS